MNKKIYVLGSLNMDLVIHSPYIPKSGETMIGTEFFTNPGGKGANQAAACGKLGGNVIMTGCVGTDNFGKEMIANLQSFNVDTTKIRQVEGSSGIAVIMIVDGDNRIILSPEANEKITTEQVDKLLENASFGDVFLTQLENPIDIVGYALKTAKEKGLYVILNPAPYNDKIEKYLPYVDLFTPNETELFWATKTDNIKDGIKKLQQMGIKETVVTLGENGNMYCGNGISKITPCIKVNVVDTTSAGDTFNGALAVKISQGIPCKNAVEFAGICASLAVTKKGAMQSIPTIREVNEFIKNNLN